MPSRDELRELIAEADSLEEKLRLHRRYTLFSVFGQTINAAEAHSGIYGITVGLWLGMYAAITGDAYVSIMLAGSLVASVIGIQFEYFDGFEEWVTLKTGSLAVLKIESEPQYFVIPLLLSMPAGSLWGALMLFAVDLA